MMNASSLLLTLTSLLAAAEVMQPDVTQFKRLRGDLERMPSYIRTEVDEGAASLSWDWLEVRHEAQDAPDRAETAWSHIRSNASYNLAGAYQILRQLPARQEEAVVSPAPLYPEPARSR